jgi:hypothetical protein
MVKFCFWISLVFFVALHTVDMLLTATYIGDDWELESCPSMSWMIKNFGIGHAVFCCRVAAGLTFFTAIYFHKRLFVQYALITFTLFYAIDMMAWLFTFKILTMPAAP